MVDVILAVGNGVVAFALAYMGVHVSLHPPREERKMAWTACFILVGLVTCGLIGLQAIRSNESVSALQSQLTGIRKSIHPAPTAQENAAAVVALEAKEKGDTKRRAPSKRSRLNTPPASRGYEAAALTVSQKSDISTDANAPQKTDVVVQTTRDFPSLKFALKCNGPIAHGSGSVGNGGVMFMTSQGVVEGHPNIFVLTYQSASPPFGPANPLHLSLWSKEPINCTGASTF